MLAPDCFPIHPRLLGDVGLNLALGLLTSYSITRLHVGDLHAVAWGEGPRALVTPVKATRLELKDII